MIKYPVNEIFTTIQGEASHQGKPSHFIRLQGCDVGCPWCDTKETWAKEESHRVELSEIITKTQPGPTWASASAQELLELTQQYPQSGVRHIVVTGGEPCLYDLGELTNLFMMAGYRVQVETSGTERIQAALGTWITVSPKIGMPGGKELIRPAIERANEIKMVIGKMADIAKLDEFLETYRPDCPIWIQPLSLSPKSTEVCMKLCTERGYRLSVQWHRMIGIR